jgi:nucleotide-binding universal stress UspA family protein
MNPNLAYSFLVPIDFTERSVHALQYAASIIQRNDGMIHLLHVIDERTPPSKEELKSTRERIAEYAREQQEKLKVNIIPHIVTGNIFISIGETAKKLGVQLIVMGIHGMHGIQFIIGSFAARVILGSPVPVLLTNGSKNYSDFKNIVLPLDMNIKMDELIKKTLEMGLQFNSTIHLYSRNEEMSFWKKKKSEIKIKQTMNMVRKAGLKCQSVTLNTDEENLADSVVEYAENINADLIMVTTQNQHNTREYIIVENGIKLMEKSKTPLFFINSLS